MKPIPTTKAPAFTLIELLLSVTVFVFISSLALVSLASTIRIQVTARQNHAISLQTDKILGVIGDDIRDSVGNNDASTTDGISIVQAQDPQTTPCEGGGVCYQNDGILVLNVARRDVDGRPSSTQEKRVYCSEPFSSGGPQVAKRMVRFTISPATASVTGSSVLCTVAGMGGLFPGATVTKEVLSDTAFDVLNFRAWPLWTAENATGASPWHNPLGVRLELMAKYTTKISNPSGEERAADSKINAPQITKRLEVYRNLH